MSCGARSRSADRRRLYASHACSLSFAAGLALVAGCTPRAKEEATELVAAVSAVRAAPDEGKAAAASRLSRVECTDNEVCAAKRECVAFADATARGLSLKREVEEGLASVHAGKMRADDPLAAAMPGKLDEASQRLTEGEAALLRCDERVVRLKFRWSL